MEPFKPEGYSGRTYPEGHEAPTTTFALMAPAGCRQAEGFSAPKLKAGSLAPASNRNREGHEAPKLKAGSLAPATSSNRNRELFQSHSLTNLVIFRRPPSRREIIT